MSSFSTKGFVIALTACALLGAGCPLLKANTPSAPQVDSNELRQPPAASAPTKAPVVPPEAANVPRPY